MYHTYMAFHVFEFDWDKGNIEKNLKKHGITCKQAEEVFNDENILFNADIRHSKNEERIIAIGKTSEGALLFIVFTRRDNKIRVISARRANTKEKILYEKSN